MVKNPPFKSDKNIFRWGPVPGHYFYTSDFVTAIFEHFPKKFLGQAWSRTLFLYTKNRMVWLNDEHELEVAGQKVFKSYIFSEKKRQTLYARWLKVVIRLSQFEEELGVLDLSNQPDDKLLALWQEFSEHILNFWLPTIPAELGNYGSPSLLQTALKRLIPLDELSSVLEVLTAPERLSFYQEEEIALSTTNDLKKHSQNYFWLKNSYAGTEVLPLSFFEKRKKELSQNLAKKLKDHLKEVAKKKNELAKIYHMTADVLSIAKALSEAVAWQDERKKYLFVLQHYKELLARAIANRSGVAWADVLNCGWDDVPKLFNSSFRNALAKRRQGFGWDLVAGNIVFADTKEALQWWGKYAEEQVVGVVNDLKGIVASKGTKPIVKGKVRIVLNPSMGFFDAGEILLAPMTSPEYVFLMKKAGAIVTDTGGLTSHAAIVSRELGIPCIIGTKIATKIFKDGDVIEVDANRGIVRKV